MIMSSYLMDSTYIDPKFPPCEEYSQNSYIPEHSPEYYSRARDPGSGYQHHHQELYPPRASYQERQYNCASIPEPDTQRGHGLPHSAHLLAGKGQPVPCETPQLPLSPSTPPTASSACNQATPDHPNSSASSKQPVVYPWMKKIHVSTGEEIYPYCKASDRIGAGKSAAIKFLSDCLQLQRTTIGGPPHVTSRFTPWATTILQPNLQDTAPDTVDEATHHNSDRFQSFVLLSTLLLVPAALSIRLTCSGAQQTR
uniref:Homeobox domain-containing protein n=1 Tax=Esox lucius TaxID=8010 RepID=A0AAY5K4D9_ESOLU